MNDCKVIDLGVISRLKGISSKPEPSPFVSDGLPSPYVWFGGHRGEKWLLAQLVGIPG
jgi:hypothetical protein